jgi:hypothetical protein
MIDLETLGSTPGCAILSIGAVVFYPRAGTSDFHPLKETLGPKFYKVISLQSNLEVDLKIDQDSFYWWLAQSEQARKALTENPCHLLTALLEFQDWLPKESFLWSHGTSFDLAVLATAYRAFGLNRPWAFRDERDTRTLLAQADMKMPSTENSHHALQDARSQAETVMKAMDKLNWYG